MADDKFKIMEERLTRIEAALSQRAAGPGGTGGVTQPGGFIVDPAPNPGYGFHPRPYPYPYPRWPIVDPAPWPPFVTDPAPWPPTTVSDPAPWGGQTHINVNEASVTARALGRIGNVGDPPPFDFSRLSAAQLESTLHSISAEKARLDSMEALVTRQLDRANLAEKTKG